MINLLEDDVVVGAKLSTSSNRTHTELICDATCEICKEDLFVGYVGKRALETTIICSDCMSDFLATTRANADLALERYECLNEDLEQLRDEKKDLSSAFEALRAAHVNLQEQMSTPRGVTTSTGIITMVEGPRAQRLTLGKDRWGILITGPGLNYPHLLSKLYRVKEAADRDAARWNEEFAS